MKSTRLNNVRAGRAETDNGDKGKSNNSNNNNNTNKNYSYETKQGVAAQIVNGNNDFWGWGSGQTRWDRLEEKGFNSKEIQAMIDANWYNDEDAFAANHWSEINAGKWAYSKFDTGGYTGDWGTDGKLAMLHEKELVLNQQDTANMLAAIDLVRQIIDTIKTPNFSSSLGNWTTSKSGDTIEQRVEVTAEFPNVIDSNEIEAALISLADNAYQYAYRS